MAHSLLHQVLVSDLVVPVMLAESGDTRSLTGSGTRLGDGTWLRSDLMVFEKGQAESELWYINGPPLLAVEVASRASRCRDLGTKKDSYERAGVPHYWVVDATGKELSLHVYELDGETYVERANVAPGESCWVTEPFRMELAPDLIFDPMSRWAPRPRRRRSRNMEHTGPDLPSSEEPILIDSFGHRWPTGAEKVELEDGCPIFYGDWDDRDVAIAERAYPGRVVRLDQPAGEPGTMTILPGPEQNRPAI